MPADAQQFMAAIGPVNRLVRLLEGNADLKRKAIFETHEERADILRYVALRLCAAMETILRNCIGGNSPIECSSRSALEKMLTRCSLDPAPFRELYPPLVQLSRRRNRVAHTAGASSAANEWGIADDWQIIMWLIAVGAFYYRMRMSLNIASAAQEEQYARNLKAMRMHVDFGKQGIHFSLLQVKGPMPSIDCHQPQMLVPTVLWFRISRSVAGVSSSSVPRRLSATIISIFLVSAGSIIRRLTLTSLPSCLSLGGPEGFVAKFWEDATQVSTSRLS
jgi:hypothetical protein